MANPPPGPEDVPCLTGSPVGSDALGAWFAGEILPLEPALTRMLRRHWRRAEDVADLRQEIYIRVYETVGREGLPDSASAYLFATARNHLINKARRARIVQFDLVAELEDLPEPPVEPWSPEQLAAARAEIDLLEAALEALPPRCREVVRLRKVEGLSQKDIAARLGITEGTVEKQVTLGVRALAEELAGHGVDAAAAWLRRPGRQGRTT